MDTPARREISCKKLTGHNEEVLCLTAREKTSELLSGSEDGTVLLWDLKTTKTSRALVVPNKEAVTSVCFSEAQDQLIYVAADTKIFQYDLRKPGLVLRTFEQEYDFNTDQINQIKIDTSGGYLAACDDAAEIKVINLKTNALLKTLQDRHTDMCSTIAFRPGKPEEVLSGGLDTTIVQWNFLVGNHQHIFQPKVQEYGESETQLVNPPHVHQISVSIDGKYLATALGNGNIEVWKLPTKTHIHTFNTHSSSASQVCFPAFAPTSHLLSGANDSTIVMYAVDFSDRIKLPKKHPGSTFKNPRKDTGVEWRISHGSKINWIETTHSQVGGNLFVADLTNKITAYTVL